MDIYSTYLTISSVPVEGVQILKIRPSSRSPPRRLFPLLSLSHHMLRQPAPPPLFTDSRGSDAETSGQSVHLLNVYVHCWEAVLHHVCLFFFFDTRSQRPSAKRVSRE